MLVGALLVAVLLSLSTFYAWRQLQMLRRLNAGTDLSPEEALWRRRQAWRRLIGCALMFVMAVLVAVAHLFLEIPTQQIADQGGAAAATEEQRWMLKLWGGVWEAVLVLLMALLAVAGVDLWSTRRFTVRQMRRIQEDRRAAIQEEIIRHKRDRNGHVRPR
jgi:hypothetical protein